MTRAMTTVDLPLLPLGRGVDLGSERGVECPGDLPSPSDPRSGGPGPGGQGGARLAGLRARPPLPARRGHPVRRRDRRLLQAGPRGGGPPGGRVHRLLRRALHGRVRRHPDHAVAEGRPARPRRRLLDGRHGPPPAGRGRVDGDAGGGCRGRGRPGHLHELQRRHQGVLRPQRRRGLHLLQRRDRARVGLPAGQQGAVPARPAPRPQHRGAEDGPRPRRLRGLGPAPPQRRAHDRAAARREDDPLEGPLLGARPVLRRGRRRPPRHDPGRADPGPPRVQARGRAQGRPGRVDRVHHPDRRGRPGRLRLGHRHRAQPCEAARAPSTPTSRSPSSTRPSATARR